jgi:hypothetical protein
MMRGEQQAALCTPREADDDRALSLHSVHDRDGVGCEFVLRVRLGFGWPI